MLTKTNKVLLTIAIILISFVSLSGCSLKKELFQTGFYFNTIIEVTLYDSNDQSIMDGCFELADYYDRIFDKNKPDSDIYKINHSYGEPVSVHPETITLLKTALEFAKKTDGRIDPTIGSVSSLWDFQGDNPSVPKTTQLSEALSHVNYQSILFEDDSVILSDPNAAIDIGFIAKGFFADQMKEYLLSKGVCSAVINLGGNVLTIGSKKDNVPFNIAIKNPDLANKEPIAIYQSIDNSIVSCGTYERFFIQNGTLYHHILNTKTGYPIMNNLSAVSVIGPSSVVCDALSTTLFILGIDEGLQFISDYSEYECAFISESGEVTTSVPDLFSY